MGKKIEFEIQEKSYILEYNRDSIKKMEALGFRTTSDFLSQPVTAIEMLFYGALLKNQPSITQSSASKIYESFIDEYDSESLAESLIEMMKGALPNANADGKQKKSFTMI